MSVDVLAAGAGRADRLALVAAERTWSYAALDDEVGRRAEELVGVRPGAPVPLVVAPDADGILTLLAIWRAGGVPAPLNPRLTDRERGRAQAALTDVPPGSQVVLWTSGTGGRPRGVALSFDNLAASTKGAAERLGLNEDDGWLASLSVAHVGGVALVVRSVLLGGTLVAPGAFDAAEVSDLLDSPERTGGRAITHMSLVPTQLLRLVELRRGAPPPRSFRCALIGGAHTPATLVARAQRVGWPLALTYGASEMSSQIATAPPQLTRLKPGSVGTPLAGVELRFADDGEILTRGATLALGYVGGAAYGGPAGRVDPLVDRDGWYHTGDLGRLDADGDLWITGRRIDRIVSGGLTIDALEVEEALRSHPAVIDACVVGLPDETWGERVAAWVEPVVGEFDVEEVSIHVRTLLDAAKLPRLWAADGPLPRNVNGKVDRIAVREALSGS